MLIFSDHAQARLLASASGWVDRRWAELPGRCLVSVAAHGYNRARRDTVDSVEYRESTEDRPSFCHPIECKALREPMGKWEIKERTQTGKAQTFRQFILFAGGLGFSLAVGLSGLTKYTAGDLVALLMSAANGNLTVLGCVEAVVYVAMFTFCLSWGLNALHEFELLQEWLKPEYVSLRRRNLIHLGTVLIGIMLGLLFAVTPSFNALMIIFVVYTLADLGMWKVRRDEIERLIGDSNRTLSRDLEECLERHDSESRKLRGRLRLFAQGAEELGNYYLKRGHYTRLLIQLVGVSLLAAAPALWGVWRGSAVPAGMTADAMTALGYLTFLVVLGSSEISVYIWRRDMDARLAELGGRLYG
jgi:hypothetical protein